MLKQLLKILFFIPVIILDGTIIALLPFGNYFLLSIILLILAVYRENPLFSKFTFITALLLGLFSASQWYIFASLVIIWGLVVRHIAAMVFAAKSVTSLVILYFISYGLFDILFLILRIIQKIVLKEPFFWIELWGELKFAGIGLLVGGVLIAVIYSVSNYFKKKFRSWFFIRQH